MLNLKRTLLFPLNTTCLLCRNISVKQQKIHEEIGKILKEKFPTNYKLKRSQKAVVTSALLGRDTFVSMPTGQGKSLCFQLPAAHDKGVTVVFSPLIFLIQDQTMKLKSRKYELPCDLYSVQKMARAMKHAKMPDFKLLFVTPEKATKNQKFWNYLRYLYRHELLSRFVIDEAHCVTRWGISFRPDYLKLGELLKAFRKRKRRRVPIMALTASHSRSECKEVVDILHMDERCKGQKGWLFTSRKERQNLHYSVVDKCRANLQQLLEHFNAKYPGQPGIIYCMTIAECLKIAKLLGDSARPYYSQMPKQQKRIYQQSWMDGTIRLLCATTAFGMGIDKSNVRFIIHHSMPRSMTDYIQESGRAGRDGQPAECVLLYNFNDQFRIMREIAVTASKLPPNEGSSVDRFQKQKLRELHQVVDYCETNCIDIEAILKNEQQQQQISPRRFKGTKLRVKPWELEKEERESVFYILNTIEQGGNVRLGTLMQVMDGDEENKQNLQRTICRLIMSGHIRISLQINPYKKCSPVLSVSTQGKGYLDDLRELYHRNLEEKEFLKILEASERIFQLENSKEEDDDDEFTENYENMFVQLHQNSYGYGQSSIQQSP